MADIEILGKDDLENVSGGAAVSSDAFYGRVTPNECVVGKYYYFVNGGNWYYGKLTKIEASRSTVFGRGVLFYFALQYINGSRTNQELCTDPYLGGLYTGMTVTL